MCTWYHPQLSIYHHCNLITLSEAVYPAGLEISPPCPRSPEQQQKTTVSMQVNLVRRNSNDVREKDQKKQEEERRWASLQTVPCPLSTFDVHPWAEDCERFSFRPIITIIKGHLLVVVGSSGRKRERARARETRDNGSPAVPIFICLLFLRSMIKLWVYTWWGPYPFHGGWPLVSIVKTVP